MPNDFLNDWLKNNGYKAKTDTSSQQTQQSSQQRNNSGNAFVDDWAKRNGYNVNNGVASKPVAAEESEFSPADSGAIGRVYNNYKSAADKIKNGTPLSQQEVNNYLAQARSAQDYLSSISGKYKNEAIGDLSSAYRDLSDYLSHYTEYSTATGQQKYSQRQEDKAKSKKAAGKALLDWLGYTASASFAPSSAKSETLKNAIEARESFEAANKASKEAIKPTEWEGRQALIDEYNDLNKKISITLGGFTLTNKEARARQREILEELRRGDTMAGNGERVYSARDASENFFSSKLKGWGKSLINFGVNVMENYVRGQAYAMSPEEVALATITGADLEGVLHSKISQYEDSNVEETFGKLYSFADMLDEQSVAELQRIKNGASAAGEIGLDIASNVVDMGFDAAVGSLTGGSTLASMFVRVYGDAAAEARHAGATLSQQTAYALASGGIEVLTEKLADGVGAIYGKGVATDITERVIRRMADTPAGMTFLRILLGSIEEGGEEVISDLLHPLAEYIYNKDALKAGLNGEEILYDFFIGAAIGMLSGSTVGLAKGQHAEANSQLIVANEMMQKLMSKGFDQNTAYRVSDIMAKAYLGEELSDVEQRELQRWPTANEVVNEMRRNDAMRRAMLEDENRRKAAGDEYSPDNWLAEDGNELAPLTDEVPENGPSDEFNSKLEGESGEVVTNPASDATMGAQPEAASKVAAQPQEGIDYGERKTNGQTAERSGVPDGRGYGQPGTQSARGRAGDQRQSDGRTVLQGTEAQNRQNEARGNSVLRRAQKVRDAIEKRLPGNSKAFAAKAYESVQMSPEFTGFLKGLDPNISEAELYKQMYTKAVSMLVDNALDGDMENLVSHLQISGLDRATAEQAAKEILEGEAPETRAVEKEATAKPDKSLTVKKQDKPIKMGKVALTTDSKGRKAVSVTEAGKSDVHIDKDVATVKNAIRYKKEKGHHRVGMKAKNGSYIMQNGNFDEYYVVDKDGYRDPTVYKNWYDAKARLYSDSKYYIVRKLQSGNPQVITMSKDGIMVDTDVAFTTDDSNIAESITMQQSQASDDLGVELSRYVTSGTTTDVLLLDLNKSAFISGENKGRYSGLQADYEQRKAMNKLLTDEYRDGMLYRKAGIKGTNGKFYVFAGQTASMRQKNIVIMMEESKYKALRSRMIGGLSESDIDKFNPAKYFTAQGTYWTPSKANTGLKGKDCIVLGDIYTIIHNVNRQFLRTSGDQSDYDTLRQAGLSDEEAKRRMRQAKVGQAFLIMGDLITKTTDGTGFINSKLKSDVQIRGLGGIKGFLKQGDLVAWLNDVIPVTGDEGFVWRDDNGNINGGIRRKSTSSGIEMLNKWGKWENIADKKVFLFESCVKFADNYTVKKADGTIDPEASTKKFYDSVGNSDIRSIPPESTFGRSIEQSREEKGDDKSTVGRVKGYRPHSMAQLLRSQVQVPQELLDRIMKENWTDPIHEILSSEKNMAQLFGVDFDSKEPPRSSDVKAQLIWYFGPRIFKTTLGKKWVNEQLVQISKDVSGGKLLFKDGTSTFQWVAPDPFGVMNAMTSLIAQVDEDQVMIGKYGKTFDETKDSPLKPDEVLVKQYKGPLSTRGKGLKRGEIYTKNLKEGLTAIGRSPSIEANDIQTRMNIRSQLYEELGKKYGFDDKALYIALADELPLNLDNDYDGDTVFAWQGALAEAIQYSREQMGKKYGRDLGRTFTEFTHAKAEKQSTSTVDFVISSIRLALSAENIGKFDMAIDYLQSMPDSYLTEAAKNEKMTPADFRNLLMMNFAAAYKFNFDFTKTGKYDPDFKKIVDDYMAQLKTIAESNGFYIPDAQEAKESNYRMPVPAYWEFSPKAEKRQRYLDAMKKQAELDKRARAGDASAMNADGTVKKTILREGPSLLAQISGEQKVQKVARAEATGDYEERMKFIEDLFPYTYPVSPVDLTEVNTIARGKYEDVVEPALMLKLAVTYEQINKYENKKMSEEEKLRTKRKMLLELYKAVNLDPEQFASLMTTALTEMGMLDKYAGWGFLLNFDQTDESTYGEDAVKGQTPVSEVFKRNARIAGTMNKINETMDNLTKQKDAIKKTIDDAFQKVENLKADQQSALKVKREMNALLNELNSTYDWLDQLYQRLQFSAETFKGKAVNKAAVAAMMGDAADFDRYEVKLAGILDRLVELHTEIVNDVSIRDSAKVQINNLNTEIKEATKAYKEALTTFSGTLDMLNDEYKLWQKRFEEQAKKAWLYGLRSDVDTGLEDEWVRETVDINLSKWFNKYGMEYGPGGEITPIDTKGEPDGTKQQLPPGQLGGNGEGNSGGNVQGTTGQGAQGNGSGGNQNGGAVQRPDGSSAGNWTSSRQRARSRNRKEIANNRNIANEFVDRKGNALVYEYGEDAEADKIYNLAEHLGIGDRIVVSKATKNGYANSYNGYYDPDSNLIVVDAYSIREHGRMTGKARKLKNTFYHESLHAFLHSMGINLMSEDGMKKRFERAKSDFQLLTDVVGEAEAYRLTSHFRSSYYQAQAASMWDVFAPRSINTPENRQAFINGFVAQELLCDIRGQIMTRLRNDEAELRQYHDKLIDILRNSDKAQFYGPNFANEAAANQYLSQTYFDEIPDNIPDVPQAQPVQPTPVPAPEPTPAPAPAAPAPAPAPEPESKPSKLEPITEPQAPDVTPAKGEQTSRAATYGGRLETIDKAVETAAANIGQKAHGLFPKIYQKNANYDKWRGDCEKFCTDFLNALAAADDGKSLLEFVYNLDKRVGKSESLRYLLGTEDDPFFKTARRLVDMMEYARENDRAIDSFRFRDAVSDLSQIFAKETEMMPKTLLARSVWSQLNKSKFQADRLLRFASKTGLGSMLFNYRRNIGNILQGLDNFDPSAKGFGYETQRNMLSWDRLAKEAVGRAMYKVLDAQRSFNKSDVSKQSVTVRMNDGSGKGVNVKLTMAQAIDMLHLIRTAERSRLDAWDDVSYLIGGEWFGINSEEQLKSVKSTLQDTINKHREALQYYYALDAAYQEFSELNEAAGANGSGRPIGIITQDYYPIVRLKRGTKKVGERDIDFGLDSTGYTLHRTKLKGGALWVTDPVERFSRYSRQAQSFITNAEVGATLSRLNRSGLAPTMNEIVGERYGKGAVDEVKRAMEIAGGAKNDTAALNQLLGQLRLNLQSGALNISIGAMLKQFPSVFNAAGQYLDFDSILHGVVMSFSPKNQKLAASQPLVQYRNISASDPSVAEALSNNGIINRLQKKLGITQLSNLGFRTFDTLAVKALYLASVWEVKAKEHLDESDGDVFWNAVDAHFAPAVLMTQLNDSMLSRGYLQNAESELVKSLGMFSNQRSLNYNTMIRAIGEYRSAVDAEGKGSDAAKKKAKALRNTIAGMFSSSLMLGIAGVISQLLRHRKKEFSDKDGELDWGKIFARMTVGAVEAGASTIPLGDAAAKIVIDKVSGVMAANAEDDDPKEGFSGFFKQGIKEYYGIDFGAIGLVLDVIDDAQSFAKEPTLAGAQRLAGDISQGLGLPLNNAYYYVSSILMYTKDSAGENPKNYDYILKYLDAQIKSDKKNEKYLTALQDVGMEKKSGRNLLLGIDANDNGTMTKEELYNYYAAHPEDEEYVKAIFNANEYKDGDWDTYKDKKESPKVSQYYKKPYQALVDSGLGKDESLAFVSHMDMDSNRSVKQAEMLEYYKLHPDDEKYIITVWNSYGYKTSWEDFKKKHKVK